MGDGRAKRIVRVGVLAAMALALAASPVLAQGNPLEDAVKATYLYKFAPFVEWPASAFESETSPLVICIAGPDPFGAALDQAVAGQHAGQHPITVRRLDKADHAPLCHILYAAPAKGQSAADLLRAAHGAVLTVTDEAGDTAARGIVNFVVQNGHVRFQIDDETAGQSGIKISSKLLSLALSVRSRR